MNLYKYILESLNDVLGFAVNLEIPKNRDFGDFSTNAAMIMAKSAGVNPREFAAQILPKISELDFVSNASIAGPGFINIQIKDDFLWTFQDIKEIDNTKKLTISMDYGSYNVAKSLHIGHLRTSIVGDTLNRVSKYLGHKTISYNYIGDWGRAMGLVIAYIEFLHPSWPFFSDNFDASKINPDDYKITADELDNYYPKASEKAKQDEDFLDRARAITFEFQNGHPGFTSLYNIFLKTSMQMMDGVISKLGIIPFDYTLGERNGSEYVKIVEKMLRDKNLLIQSDGATIVDIKQETDTEPMPPFMLYNSRGAQTYHATDLATIYFRKKNDNPDKLWYLTDVRQQLNFKQVFRTSEMLGLYPAENMEHLYFGTINGPGGIPFKTRDGNAAGLLDIIKMVEDAVSEKITESGKSLSAETVQMIALSALKFTDLMHDVKSDYIFDTSIVTSFEGRTGPYILYTAVRLNSVLKKTNKEITRAKLVGLEKQERNLLLNIYDFGRAISGTFDNRSPDILANYTYELCQSINAFYHSCPILRDDVDKDIQNQRLYITQMAFNTLMDLITLMGLEIPDEM